MWRLGEEKEGDEGGRKVEKSEGWKERRLGMKEVCQIVDKAFLLGLLHITGITRLEILLLLSFHK